MKKKLKLSILSVLAGVFVLTVIPGCNKYPEGPSLSLRTRKARLVNDWRIENYKFNDTDLTSLVTGYSETFTKNDDYSYEWGLANGSGTWAFIEDYEKVKLTGSDDQSSRTLVILKLEEKALWYYYMDGNDRNEYHMVPK